MADLYAQLVDEVASPATSETAATGEASPGRPPAEMGGPLDQVDDAGSGASEAASGSAPPDLTVPPWERRADFKKGTYNPKEYFAVYPELRCTKIKKNGEQCWQITMPGQKMCRIHLGGAARPGSKRPAKDGKFATSIWAPTSGPGGLPAPPPPKKYSSALKHAPKLRQLYEQYWSDPYLLNLQAEIAMARALLADYSERVAKTLAGKDTDGRPIILEDAQRHMIALTEQIGKLIERKHKMDFGEQHTVTVNALDSYAARIADIIMTEVLPLVGGAEAVGRIRAQFVILFGNDGQPVPIRPQLNPPLAPPSPFRVESLPDDVTDGEWTEINPQPDGEDR